MIGKCLFCGIDLDDLPPYANMAPHYDGRCVPLNRLKTLCRNMNHEVKSPFDEMVQDSIEIILEELLKRAQSEQTDPAKR